MFYRKRKFLFTKTYQGLEVNFSDHIYRGGMREALGFISGVHFPGLQWSMCELEIERALFQLDSRAQWSTLWCNSKEIDLQEC